MSEGDIFFYIPKRAETSEYEVCFLFKQTKIDRHCSKPNEVVIER